MGSRSAATSPAMDTFHQSSSYSYAEQNGYTSSPLHLDESRYSPVPSRSPRLQKPLKARHHCDTDQTNQRTSSPGQESRPVLSRAERMAALERRMVANGLSAPGRSKASLGPKRLGQAGVTHVGAVQMSDCATTSGSESSESEVETNRGNCSSPMMFGKPAEAGTASPIPRVGSNSPHLSASSGHSHGMVNGQKSLELCSHSPDGRQPSPLTSPLLNDACSVRTDDEDEVRRKRFPTDRAYFIAKELLTTERTYLKDLEVVTVSFQNAVGQDEATPDSLKNTVFPAFEPLHKFHTGFLREVEQRLALWEGRSNAHIKGDYQRIGDVMLKNFQGLKPLTANLHKQSEVLLEIEKACRSSRKLEGLCRDFELQKVCYVPLNVFILRPLHRLIHYKQILERLCKHYPATHVDFRDCRAALADVSEVVDQLQGSLIKMENFQKLLELKKDLIGVDNLVVPGREFIRLGCLSKLSGKGLQQRMFFLIRESEDEWGVPHAFTLVGQQQSVVVAASSLTEMEKWMTDIKAAIEAAKTSNGPSSDLLTNNLTDNKDPSPVSGNKAPPVGPPSGQGPVPLSVICWYRVQSLSFSESCRSLENQLSGNLLRKFKNSNGWQKLWVVFTNFSLFFYKSHQSPSPQSLRNIHKDYVFKLHFKSHVYYFRAESEYTFERWMEVIRSATVPSSGARVLNNKESHPH
ncbi:hypothetical protein GBF38_017078 [Nibea albiflora]|uniref:Uncharacterized protein n=1 Tax=Nibea albiflora TaxID=240163 RepID=A0ACB7EEN8_NIBAL|nr:hypothetical protein GBF38_017078 [Nibea albiflora]